MNEQILQEISEFWYFISNIVDGFDRLAFSSHHIPARHKCPSDS